MSLEIKTHISCFNAFHAFPVSILKVSVSTQGNELPTSSQVFLDAKHHWGIQLYLSASQKYQD